MTTTKIQPTKGPVYVSEEFRQVRADDYTICRADWNYERDGLDEEDSTPLIQQDIANLHFIADAFNTHTTTGMTPSELADRVKVLEEACRSVARLLDSGLLKWDPQYHGEDSITSDADAELRAALNPAGGGM